MSWLYKKQMPCTEGRTKVWFVVIAYSSELYSWCLYQQWICLAKVACLRGTHHTCAQSTGRVRILCPPCKKGAHRVPWFVPYLFHHERKTNFRHVSTTLKSVLYHFKYRDSVNIRRTSAAQSCPCRHILCHLWQVHGQEKGKSNRTGNSNQY